MNLTATTLIDEVQRNFPELWDHVYPRVYENIGNFHSPKLAAASMANAVIAAEMAKIRNSDAVRNNYIVACQCEKHNYPTFFVTTSMLQAVNQTNLPNDLNWVDIPMPHPGMIFIFEKGAVLHPQDGSISYLALARIKSGDRIKHPFSAEGGNMRTGGILTMTAAHESAGHYHYDFCMNEDSSPTVASIQSASEIILARPENTTWDMALTADAKEFNRCMILTALKLVLVMNARPEQVSSGQLLRTIKPKHPGQSPKQFWTPNIIGRNYNKKTEGPPPETPTTTGEGSGKRAHWRRGHFTQQPYGPNHSLRKTLWREPVLVGEF